MTCLEFTSTSKVLLIATLLMPDRLEAENVESGENKYLELSTYPFDPL